MPELFDFRVEPFPHQLQEFMEARELPFRAQLWEQGTAKSKPVIDQSAHLFLSGKINCCIVVGPAGVDKNWVTEQLPMHLPEPLRAGLQFSADDVMPLPDGARHVLLGSTRLQLYDPDKRGVQWHERELRQSIYHEGMLYLCVPYDLFISKRGKAFVWEVLKRRRCLYVLDEASNIKTPSAKRTISINKSAVYAPYRRILEGTPVGNAPFDVYTQVKFLDPEFWVREFEISTAAEFRQYFGMYVQVTRPGMERGTKNQWDLGELVGYKRLNQLQEALKKLGSRIVKTDVLKDLPPKLYDKHYITLNPEQRRVYKELKENYMAEVGGGVVSAPLAITRLLRFQQVVCGYVPVDSDDGEPEPVALLGKSNPRLEGLEYLSKTVTHQGIIWCRFRKDVELITGMLGKRCTRYGGDASDDEVQRNKEAFKRGDHQWLVASIARMHRGHTYNNALTSIYYSNTYNFIHREQSEDRNHRAGQLNQVDYIDIIAQGTVDTSIVQNLRRKLDIASQVTGDKLRSWI